MFDTRRTGNTSPAGTHSLPIDEVYRGIEIARHTCISLASTGTADDGLRLSA